MHAYTIYIEITVIRSRLYLVEHRERKREKREYINFRQKRRKYVTSINYYSKRKEGGGEPKTHKKGIFLCVSLFPRSPSL